MQRSLIILVNQFWLCRRFMEHFSRAVTDYAFTVELLSEVTNHDALSLCVCMYIHMYTYIHMYVCIYVYLSHSFRDILIAQLPAVCRCHARQLRSTLHHHWPRIGLLYHFLVVCCIKLCLVLKYVLNDCRCVCHFGWGHSHHVVQAPSPTPSECAHHSRSTKQDSYLNMWVSIAPHVYPVLDSER